MSCQGKQVLLQHFPLIIAKSKELDTNNSKDVSKDKNDDVSKGKNDGL